MAKIWTTLAAGYLKGRWGAWEFVREMIQNGRDAEVEHGAKLAVEWKNGTLRIEIPQKRLTFPWVRVR